MKSALAMAGLIALSLLGPDQAAFEARVTLTGMK